MQINPQNLAKKGGITGIVVGLLALLACELPILLALVGIGGLGATAATFSPTPLMEGISILLLLIGLGTMITLKMRRKNED